MAPKKPREWRILAPEATVMAETSVRDALRAAEAEQAHGLATCLRQILDRNGSVGFSSYPALDAWFATASIGAAPAELTRFVQTSRCWPRWSVDPARNQRTVTPRAFCGMIVALCVTPDNADRFTHGELLDTIGAAMLSTSDGPLPLDQLGDATQLREPWNRAWALLSEARVPLPWTERNLREAASGVPLALPPKGEVPKPKQKTQGTKILEGLAQDALWQVARNLARAAGF